MATKELGHAERMSAECEALRSVIVKDSGVTWPDILAGLVRHQVDFQPGSVPYGPTSYNPMPLLHYLTIETKDADRFNELFRDNLKTGFQDRMSRLYGFYKIVDHGKFLECKTQVSIVSGLVLEETVIGSVDKFKSSDRGSYWRNLR